MRILRQSCGELLSFFDGVRWVDFSTIFFSITTMLTNLLNLLNLSVFFSLCFLLFLGFGSVFFPMINYPPEV